MQPDNFPLCNAINVVKGSWTALSRLRKCVILSELAKDLDLATLQESALFLRIEIPREYTRNGSFLRVETGSRGPSNSLCARHIAD
jgi:hypothetical protein